MNDILRDIQRLDELSNGVMDQIEAGRLDEAERLCEKLLQAYPDQIDGHKRMAKVREAQGRWAEAVAAYDRALLHIERHPEGFDHEMVDILREKRAAACQRADQHA